VEFGSNLQTHYTKFLFAVYTGILQLMQEQGIKIYSVDFCRALRGFYCWPLKVYIYASGAFEDLISCK